MQDHDEALKQAVGPKIAHQAAQHGGTMLRNGVSATATDEDPEVQRVIDNASAAFDDLGSTDD